MLNINVGLLSDYFLPIVSDYTLIASKQSTPLLHTLFGSQWFGIFDSDLAVNYITFGSEQWKLVGNCDHHPDAALCSGMSILRVSTYIFANFSWNPTSTLNLTVSLESQWNVDSSDTEIQKYYRNITEIFVHTEILSTSHARIKYIFVKNHTIETIGPMEKNTAKIYPFP